VFNSPGGEVPLGLREIFSGCQWMGKVPNAVEILPKISTAWVGRTIVTDDRQTDIRQTDVRQQIANVNVSSRSLKTMPTLYIIRNKSVRLWSCQWTARAAAVQTDGQLAALHECRSAIVLHDGGDASDGRSIAVVLEYVALWIILPSGIMLAWKVPPLWSTRAKRLSWLTK